MAGQKNPKVEAAVLHVQNYAEQIGADPENVVHWGGAEMQRFVGDRGGANYLASHFCGAIVFEDSDFDAVSWAPKLQKLFDPNYEYLIFEPYNSFIIEAWKEG
jgi:hypothetical protein